MCVSIRKTLIPLLLCALTVGACHSGSKADVQKTSSALQSAQEGNTIVVKLDEGDDLWVKMYEVIDRYQIESGIFLSGIGQWRNFTVGLYDAKQIKFLPTFYTDPHELVGMHGTIAHGTDGVLRLHIHGVLGDQTNKAVAGHISGATAAMANEIVILKLNSIELSRVYNLENGLWELDVHTKGAADAATKPDGGSYDPSAEVWGWPTEACKACVSTTCGSPNPYPICQADPTCVAAVKNYLTCWKDASYARDQVIVCGFYTVGSLDGQPIPAEGHAITSSCMGDSSPCLAACGSSDLHL
jgi:predicted DNA-binding protein with PD1-like motif